MRPRVEILTIAECPHRQPTRELVDRIAAELDVLPAVELVEVPDSTAAERLRFLGSPSVRVDGLDVEPGADQRRSYGVTCRVYRTADGLSGQPAESWVRAAFVKKP